MTNEGEEVDVGDLKEEEKDDGGEKCDVCMASLGPGTTLLEHYRQQHILQQGRGIIQPSIPCHILPKFIKHPQLLYHVLMDS